MKKVVAVLGDYYHNEELISESLDRVVLKLKVDGAGFLGIFRHIMIPLSITSFVVVAI